MKNIAYILLALGVAYGVYYFFFRKETATTSAPIPEATPEQRARNEAARARFNFINNMPPLTFNTAPLDVSQSVAIDITQLSQTLNP